ncbi:hypothetical protein PCCS19_16850 [Paenibacillus sp. CCS19]|uniref:helix-turn-helix domain-containing protein n=1 Tax=Paenibacillus sp. CCS19 TaxID=3158387 RepID=UPI0025636B1F|nr:helix-turn-helix transcriptional regulator [Paenibacillus cellulosilyticus]GMK38631.1 hypothetical protein PCCS19_16850 [Paenibacillus cellulosilyticus]
MAFRRVSGARTHNGWSKQKSSKYYKQETGENLSDFLLAKRLERATQLLRESTLHIVDISLMVGYKKPQYFIKLFKEKYGVTPYQFRRNQM